MRRLVGPLFVFLIVLNSSASAGGRAQLLSFGNRGAKGVSAVSFSHRFTTPEGSASTVRSGTSVVNGSGVPAVSTATNRCTATNVGGSFTYTFGAGVECASFAAPSPDAPTPSRPQRPQPPSPEQIAAALFDRAISLAPDPDLEVAPGRLGLTGLPSYFWLAEPPRPLTATANAGPVTITAEAHPSSYVWDFGDGRETTTSRSGRRWRAGRHGSIAHSYEIAGRYDLSVEVLWTARWRTNRGPWRHLGYFSTSDTRPYAVRELLTWLVPWR